MEAHEKSQAMTAAAEQMIRSRIAAIEPAATAQGRIEELESQLATARGEADRAYRAALSAGWTQTELKQLGLDAPARRPTRRKSGKPRARQDEGQPGTVQQSGGTDG